jgi:hypothetical protein
MKMIDKFIEPSDLQSSAEMLDQLLKEVAKQEGRLSGGRKLGVGEDTLQKLKETLVRLGNPRDSLVRLTPALFKSVGVELRDIWKKQMKEEYDFYYITLPVSLQPGPGVQFVELECRFTFGPEGSEDPIIQSFFPTSEWKDVLEWGAGMKLALDGDLSYNMGIDGTVLQNRQIPQQIKAKVFNANELQGFIAIPDFRYNLGRAETVAGGTGSNICFWRIQKPSLRQLYDVPLSAIFKVPQTVQTLHLTGMAAAKPSFAWLTANLRDVYEYLSEQGKSLLRMKDSERQGKDWLPKGDAEEWTLHLPK